MALSAAQRKQQQEAAKRAKAAKAQAEARAARLRAQTQERLRAEIDAKAKKERDRLISRYQTQSIWGGGQAARDKANNDLRYNESQRVKRQDAITKAQNKDKPAAKPAGKSAQSDADFDRRYGTNDPRNNLARRETGKTPAPAPRPAGTQPSRPAARPAASRPSTPAATKKPAAAPSGERRVSAATANRESGNYGTSRTDNKMIDDWMRQKMREREGRDLTSKGSDYGSKAMSKQFASKGASADTGYTPKTKADGSKYAGKQPTNETKTAYDSKTNLKPSAPSKPATPNDKPDVKYNPSTKVDGAKYSDKKPENSTQLAFKSKGAESLAEMMRKRRQG